jgi:hypothetical protein
MKLILDELRPASADVAASTYGRLGHGLVLAAASSVAVLRGRRRLGGTRGGAVAGATGPRPEGFHRDDNEAERRTFELARHLSKVEDEAARERAVL